MACSHDTPKSFLNQSAVADKAAKDESINDIENKDGLGDAIPFPTEEKEDKIEDIERKSIPRFKQSLHMPNYQIANTQQEACVTLQPAHVPNDPEPLDPQHEASIELHGIAEPEQEHELPTENLLNPEHEPPKANFLKPEHEPPTENPLQPDHKHHTESPTNTEHEPLTLQSEHELREEAELNDEAHVESSAEDPELSPSPPTPQDQELQQFLETAVQKSMEKEWEYQSQLVAPNPPLPFELPSSSCLVPNPCSQPEPPTCTVSSETESSFLCHPVRVFNNCVPVFIHGLQVEVEWNINHS